jgi:hypothetical protein
LKDIWSSLEDWQQTVLFYAVVVLLISLSTLGFAVSSWLIKQTKQDKEK